MLYNIVLDSAIHQHESAMINQLLGKDSDAGKHRKQKETRVAEDEMVGWYHQLNGHELGQILGDSEGQGGLAGCSPWGCKASDTI